MIGSEEIGTAIIFVTATASYVNHRFLQLPKSIGLTFITLLCALCLVTIDYLTPLSMTQMVMNAVSGLEFSRTFLHKMLGYLLFAGALQIDARDLYKHKMIISLLSTVSVLISTAVIGIGTWLMAQLTGLHISFLSCLLFGSLISPTDPVAVMSILKSSKAPKSLEMKIAGEALFNDAMGIVLFVALSGAIDGSLELSLFGFVAFFLRQALGGFVFGLFSGKIFTKLIAKIDSAFVLMMMTMAFVATVYLVAEHSLHVSAVITIGVSGLYIGQALRCGIFSRSLTDHLYEFWDFVDEILNAFLFAIIGLEFFELQSSSVIYITSVGIIGVTVIARWISVAVPLTWIAGLRLVNSKLIWLMTWGGMRGGISIALALMIADQNPDRESILTMTYSVVIFSIIIQGMTIAPLLSQMNLSQAALKPKDNEMQKDFDSLEDANTSSLSVA